MKKGFIKVTTYDVKNCCDSISIVNKECIERFEITNFYEENYCSATLFLKNGTEIFVMQESIDPIQEALLGTVIKRKKKAKLKNIGNAECINDYFDCNLSWDKNIGIGNRMSILQELTNNYKEEIATKIKLMSYQEFLQTPYWKTISLYKKITEKKCELCGSEFNLRTHHKTYKHHGYELLYLNELQVLCEKCHQKKHKDTTVKMVKEGII